MVNQSRLQQAILLLLAKQSMNLGSLGAHQYGQTMPQSLIDLFDGQTESSMIHPVQEAVWSLVARGFAYIDYLQDNKFHWQVIITDAGRIAAKDEAPNPDNVELYIKQLRAKVPTISGTVEQYAREACMTYTTRCFLASSVMLGVASEAAFLEMAAAFAKWKHTQDGEAFGKVVDNPLRSLNDKFKQFRNRLDPNRKLLPRDLEDNLTITFDAILDLLRIARNDTGHPTGRNVSADDVRVHLVVFGAYVARIYSLKSVFDADPL